MWDGLGIPPPLVYSKDMENIAGAAPTLTLVALFFAHIGGFLTLPFLPTF